MCVSHIHIKHDGVVVSAVASQHKGSWFDFSSQCGVCPMLVFSLDPLTGWVCWLNTFDIFLNYLQTLCPKTQSTNYSIWTKHLTLLVKLTKTKVLPLLRSAQCHPATISPTLQQKNKNSAQKMQLEFFCGSSTEITKVWDKIRSRTSASVIIII